MLKRTFDLIMSAIGLIVLSPVFIVIAIFIVLDSKGGIFFRGVRVGKNGKPFRIFKFRSMIANAEGNGKWNVGDNDKRITRVGHFLRNTKIDELPQLINVLIGDMSFVGPRPELQYYIDIYTEKEMQLLDLKPGITDWASIVNFDQFTAFTVSDDPDATYLRRIRPLKLKLQLYYREHNDFLSDIKILFWTVYKVVVRTSRVPEDIEDLVYGHSESIKDNSVSRSRTINV